MIRIFSFFLIAAVALPCRAVGQAAHPEDPKSGAYDCGTLCFIFSSESRADRLI